MLTDRKIVVIGGGSGMGLEVARKASQEGAQVVIAGRSVQRLRDAAKEIGETRVEAIVCDIGDQTQVAHLFGRIGELDHLVVTAADLPYGPIQELTESDLMRAVRSKFLGLVFVAQQAASRIRPSGSITFTSGIASRRPMRGGATAAAINGAVEGLGRALAIELAPLRVNVLSPGWTDTPIWGALSAITTERKAELFSQMAAKLPVQRIGDASEMADAILFLMKNQFMTGTVVNVDGGHSLV
jgi:NAD(P)-dependent dehydrogenase (short-subunit alcohol dehydrogenase family)